MSILHIALIRIVRHTQQNACCFRSMVLTICARSNEPDAASRATAILDSMEHAHNNQNRKRIIACSRCYSAVITAWARSGSSDAVQQAFALIDRMEQNRRDGSPHGSPNARCYNSAIHTIAKSSDQKNKVDYCMDILRRMNSAKENGFIDCSPTTVTYSTIINACAYTTGDEECRRRAFDVARSCLQTLLASKELEPDESIFSNLLLVAQRHLGDGEARDRFAEALFKEACKVGVVNRDILVRFRRVSPRSAKRLLEHQDDDSILQECGKNIGKKDRFIRS